MMLWGRVGVDPPPKVVNALSFEPTEPRLIKVWIALPEFGKFFGNFLGAFGPGVWFVSFGSRVYWGCGPEVFSGFLAVSVSFIPGWVFCPRFGPGGSGV